MVALDPGTRPLTLLRENELKKRGKGEPQATNGVVGKEGMEWVPSKPIVIYPPRISLFMPVSW